MSQQTEKLKHNAHEKLENITQQLDRAKLSVESTFDKTITQVESKLEEAKASLHETRKQFRKNRAQLKAEAKEHRRKIEESLERLREAAESKQLEKTRHKAMIRAEKAEQHAQICLDCATVAIAEAELACIEACHARLEAEELSPVAV